MNEILGRIILTGLVLALGISLVFLTDFLLDYLNKTGVLLLLVSIGVILVGLAIRQAGTNPE